MDLRRASAGDAERCHAILWSSATAYAARRGMPLEGTADEWWATSGSLYRLIAEIAVEWWVAEEAGEIVGFARSIEREGLLELTEFFVAPSRQSKGIGKALLDRAFPANRGRVRSIVATIDERALARYYAAGTTARFPILEVSGVPRRTEHAIDARRIDLDRDTTTIRDLERAALDHARSERELRWLAEAREGWLWSRDGAVIGFGFVSARGAGPIVAVDPRHVPEILLHVEDRAAALGAERLELELPAPNEVGIRHLLARGFHVDPWVNVLMSDRAFGRFDRVVPFAPPLFL